MNFEEVVGSEGSEETFFYSSGSCSNNGGRPGNQNNELFVSPECSPTKKIINIKCGTKLNNHCLCVLKFEDATICAFHMTSRGLSLVKPKLEHFQYYDGTVETSLSNVKNKKTINNYIDHINSNYLVEADETAVNYIFGRNCVFTCVSLLNYLDSSNDEVDICLLKDSMAWYARAVCVFPLPVCTQLKGIADQTIKGLVAGKIGFCNDYKRYCGNNFGMFLTKWNSLGKVISNNCEISLEETFKKLENEVDVLF